MRMRSRKSWSHRWKLFGLVEIMFSTLIAVYENSITAGVVVPSVPQPYSNTRELYNNNYTFVSETPPDTIYTWLSDEYSTKNHIKVLSIRNFASLWSWLERFFIEPKQGEKYAIVGDLSKNCHYRVVTFVKERNHTCYQMYPPEEAFTARPIFFTFQSAVASSLQKGLSRLQAFGFVRAFEAPLDFLGASVAISYTRDLAADYGYQGITYKDIKHNRLKESMVTLGNLRSIFYLELTLHIAAGVGLIGELVVRK